MVFFVGGLVSFFFFFFLLQVSVYFEEALKIMFVKSCIADCVFWTAVVSQVRTFPARISFLHLLLWSNIKVRLHYATKLITSTLKNNFLPTIFQFTKTVELKTCTHQMPCQKLCLPTIDGRYRHSKSLMRLTFCQSNFHAAQHSAICYGMQKPCRSRATLTSALISVFATQ